MTGFVPVLVLPPELDPLSARSVILGVKISGLTILGVKILGVKIFALTIVLTIVGFAIWMEVISLVLSTEVIFGVKIVGVEI